MSENRRKTIFQEYSINVKLQLSILWITLLIFYIYGDLFYTWEPEHLKGLLKGETDDGKTTPMSLVAASIFITIPALMILLSIMLNAKMSRLINIIVGGLYSTAVILVLALFSYPPIMYFFVFLNGIEIIITLLIVYFAWKWPVQIK